MPSPVGHLIGGAIVGLAIAPSDVIVCAIAGALPDFDFLVGGHRGASHSLTMAVVAGLVVLAATRGRRPILAIAVTLAWASHILLDWLAEDTTPPFGVMALWPFTDAFYIAPAQVFEAITRRYWLPNFIPHNTWAVTKEILILGPIAFLLRGRLRFRRRDTASQRPA